MLKKGSELAVLCHRKEEHLVALCSQAISCIGLI